MNESTGGARGCYFYGRGCSSPEDAQVKHCGGCGKDFCEKCYWRLDKRIKAAGTEFASAVMRAVGRSRGEHDHE